MFVYIFMCMYIEKLYVVYIDSILSSAKAGRLNPVEEFTQITRL